MRSRSTASRTLPLLVGVVAASVCSAAPGTAVSRGPTRCTASVVHPVSVHVTALDPIVRGGVVHLRVTTSSVIPLDNAEIRLASLGGAQNRGPSIVALGSLSPSRAAQGVFSVAIPSSGGRQLVQFRVTGQGPQGRLTRGGSYNLLPDGPAEIGRTVVTPQGSRVLEFAARRINP